MICKTICLSGLLSSERYDLHIHANADHTWLLMDHPNFQITRTHDIQSTVMTNEDQIFLTSISSSLLYYHTSDYLSHLLL